MIITLRKSVAALAAAIAISGLAAVAPAQAATSTSGVTTTSFTGGTVQYGHKCPYIPPGRLIYVA